MTPLVEGLTLRAINYSQNKVQVVRKTSCKRRDGVRSREQKMEFIRETTSDSCGWIVGTAGLLDDVGLRDHSLGVRCDILRCLFLTGFTSGSRGSNSK